MQLYINYRSAGFHPFLFVLMFISIFTGCSSLKTSQPTNLQEYERTALYDPRYIEAEFIIRIDSIFASEEDIVPYSRPTLMIWASGPFNLPNQKIEKLLYSGEQPDNITSDIENSNTIAFWDLSDKAGIGDQIVISRKFSGYLYDYHPTFNQILTMDDYDTIPRNLFYFYTKSEPYLEQTPEIINLAHTTTGGKKSIYDAAKDIFEWVNKKMKYVYPPEARGVLAAYKSLEGDCGQYSALFITLCRAIGIPARQQSGFSIDKGKFGYHVWSEIYVPGQGWIPMDTTVPDGFGHIKNTQLVASVGMNIPLTGVPSWANYEKHDAQGQRTDFMQFMTTVKNGIKARILTERRLLEFREVKQP